MRLMPRRVAGPLSGAALAFAAHLCGFAVRQAAAQAPVNDNFPGTAVSGTTFSVAGSNVNATAQGGEPNPAGVSGTASVWWTWTAGATGTAVVDTNGSTSTTLFPGFDLDTTLGAYTGTVVSSLTMLDENDDYLFIGGPSRVTFPVTAGNVYRIQVNGYDYGPGNGADMGSIQLNFAIVTPPANDDFPGTTISGIAASDSGSNILATGEPGEPDHAGTSAPLNSLWWSWTAPASGWVTIDTLASAIDTTLAVYTGAAVNALTLVAWDDDSLGALQSEVNFSAVAGTTYRIAVDGYGTDSGAVALSLSLSVPNYSTDFAAPGGWTLSGLWAMDATPAAFPGGISRSGNSLNYNDGTAYPGANTGSALSPSVSLAGLTNPVLRFWCNYQTETRGTLYDRRFLEIENGSGTVVANWQLASVGYSFSAAGGITDAGPGPCAEGYVDLESGVPVSGWHRHRIPLDPAWSSIRVRFIFDTVDNLRNGYAGWAVDDLEVLGWNSGPPTGWPDNFPDTAFDEIAGSPPNPDGYELDICERQGNFLRYSWGCNNRGTPGVHMIIGNDRRAILDETFMFYDAVHAHYHMSQYADFSLWQYQGTDFVKVRRGPKRSYCLTDIDQTGAGPSVSPFCNQPLQCISYNWQDVYDINTPGQEIDVSGLASGTYTLVGVIDPINRLRETSNLNQADQIEFSLTGGAGQVAIASHTNPYPQSPTALSITSASTGTYGGAAAVQVIGTGFDAMLTPVMYDVGTAVAEAPFYAIVSPTEIWVTVPGAVSTPASIDLLRADGSAASIRIGGGPPPPVNDMFPGTTLSGQSPAAAGTNAGATVQPGEPDPAGGSGSVSVWWTWTSVGNGTATIDTFGSGFDTTLGVYTGNAVGSLALVGENDNSGGAQSLVTFTATVGTTYRILVNGNAGATGAISLNISGPPPPPPANDNFSSAAPLAGSSVTTNGTTVSSSGEAGEPDHAGASAPLNSIWWSWTAPANGTLVVNTTGSAFDTTLAVYTGPAVNSLTQVAANNDSGGPQSRVTLSVTAGTTYSIAVDGAGAATGAVSLSLSFTAARYPAGMCGALGAEFLFLPLLLGLARRRRT